MRNTSFRRAVVPGVAALALALSACGGGDESGSESAGGTVATDGSSTVYPMTSTAKEMLTESGSKTKVSVGFSGTGGGFEKFCAGSTDVSNASRPIKDEEVAACEENGVEFTELNVATDALTVVVHPDLAVDCLTTDEVSALFGPEATAKKWSDINPEFPDTKIAGFIPGADSGTYDYMAADVIGHDTEALREDFEVSEDDNILVQGVSGTEGGVGFFGYTYFEENADKLKALSIDNGNGCVEPSAATAQAGEYAPLARPLFIYVNNAKYNEKETTKEFVDYYVENLTEVAEAAQFIPLSEDALAQTQEKLAGIAG